MNKNVYSVSEVNTYIDRMFKDDFMLGNLSLTGEVSNCKYNHTGHIYFTLKDENSAISCAMWASKRYKGLKFQMKDGDKVVVTGLDENGNKVRMRVGGLLSTCVQHETDHLDGVLFIDKADPESLHTSEVNKKDGDEEE